MGGDGSDGYLGGFGPAGEGAVEDVVGDGAAGAGDEDQAGVGFGGSSENLVLVRKKVDSSGGVGVGD